MIRYNSKLLQNRGSLIVACSGGVDSIACAHFMAKANPLISLFHFNHRFRPQNDKMREAVSEFGQSLNLWTFFGDADKFPIDLSKGVEAGAREARLKAMTHLGPWCSKIVICHHLDDAVESYLMNCFKGKTTGPVIPPRSDFGNFTLYRPFLLTKKEDLRNYAEKHDLYRYVVEDETNIDTTYRRNFIRNTVLPTLQPHYPGLQSVVEEKVKKDFSDSMM